MKTDKHLEINGSEESKSPLQSRLSGCNGTSSVIAVAQNGLRSKAKCDVCDAELLGSQTNTSKFPGSRSEQPVSQNKSSAK